MDHLKEEKPILAHVHLFYPELWPELKSALQNISPHPLELCVTLVRHHEELESDIAQAFPGSTIEIVENRGYDIAPFLHVIRKADLSQYSYVIKLHTKRATDNTPFLGVRGNMWRTHLLAFLSSSERFNEHLAAFDSNPKLGMQADYHVLLRPQEWYEETGTRIYHEWLEAHNLPKGRILFAAGTMFIVRAALLEDMLPYAPATKDFPDTINHTQNIAHVWERLFGYFVYRSGYILADRNKAFTPALYRLLSRIVYTSRRFSKRLYRKLRKTLAIGKRDQ